MTTRRHDLVVPALVAISLALLTAWSLDGARAVAPEFVTCASRDLLYERVNDPATATARGSAGARAALERFLGAEYPHLTMADVEPLAAPRGVAEFGIRSGDVLKARFRVEERSDAWFVMRMEACDSLLETSREPSL